MFTGIVQAMGKVVAPARPGPYRISITAPHADWEPWTVGESVAVNGCCLTVVWEARGELAFDLSDETLNRTTLGSHRGDEAVNIERAMRATDRFGGHIVQGHVDSVGEVVSVDPVSGVFRFRTEPDDQRFLADKGSIAVDGISLTVVEPRGQEFDVAVIPHTLSATNLSTRKPGHRVNLEFDVIAKHVERLLAFRQ